MSQWRIIRAISVIGEVELSSRKRSLVMQRLRTCFLTMRSRVQFPPDSVGALLKISKQKKQLFSAPASFRLSTLLTDDEFLIENHYRKTCFMMLGKTNASRSKSEISAIFVHK